MGFLTVNASVFSDFTVPELFKLAKESLSTGKISKEFLEKSSLRQACTYSHLTLPHNFYFS